LERPEIGLEKFFESNFWSFSLSITRI